MPPAKQAKIQDHYPDLIYELLSKGVYPITAAKKLKVNPTTINRWRKRGELSKHKAKDCLYREFYEKYEEALVDIQLRLLEKVEEGKPGWVSKAWILERRFKSLWSTRTINYNQNIVSEKKLPQKLQFFDTKDEDPPAAKKSKKPKARRKARNAS